MARFSIVPERSQVWIDARSNVHPIHSATTGLEGLRRPRPRAGRHPRPVHAAHRQALAVRRQAEGGQPHGGPRDAEADRRPALPAHRGRARPGDAQRIRRPYRVSGNVTFRGVKRHHEDLLSIDALDDQTIRLTGSSRFDIREFGMQAPKVLHAQGRARGGRPASRSWPCGTKTRRTRDTREATTMCLGIPGQLKEITETNPHLARVEVSGVTRHRQHRAPRGRGPHARATGCSSTWASPCRRSTRRRPRWPWPRCSSWAGPTTTSSMRSGRRRSQVNQEQEVRNGSDPGRGDRLRARAAGPGPMPGPSSRRRGTPSTPPRRSGTCWRAGCPSPVNWWRSGPRSSPASSAPSRRRG